MKTLFDSAVRTVVPIVVGAVIAWTVTQGIPLDDQFELALTLALTALFQGAYYFVVRLLEEYVAPKFGWLLGLARQPLYAKRGTDGSYVITGLPDPRTSTREEYQGALDDRDDSGQ